MFIPNVTSTASSVQFRQVVDREPTRALNVEEVQMILTDETKDLSIPMHVTEGTSEDRRGLVQPVCHAFLHDARLSTSVTDLGGRRAVPTGCMDQFLTLNSTFYILQFALTRGILQSPTLQQPNVYTSTVQPSSNWCNRRRS